MPYILEVRRDRPAKFFLVRDVVEPFSLDSFCDRPFMNFREQTGSVCVADELLELQLRVARRADELATARKTQTALNLHCWLMAETEVLGRTLMDQPTFIPRSGFPADMMKDASTRPPA